MTYTSIEGRDEEHVDVTWWLTFFPLNTLRDNGKLDAAINLYNHTEH